MDLAPLAVASVRRANRTYFDLTTERHQLSIGEARIRPGASFGIITDVLLDPVLVEGRDFRAEVDAFFAERGAACMRWIPAVEQPIGELESALSPIGFERDDWTAAVLPVDAPVPDLPALRVFSGRAMPRAYRAVLADRCDELSTQPEAGRTPAPPGPTPASPGSGRLPCRPSNAAQATAAGGAFATTAHAVTADDGCPTLPRAAAEVWLDAELGKLDSPQYEPLAALLDDCPAGALGLYQTGEVGRLSDLHVCEAARGKGVAATLVAAAIRMARRWSIRYICAQFSRNSAAGPRIEALLKGTGFSVGGTIATLRLPEAGDGNW